MSKTVNENETTQKIRAWITWPDGAEFGWYHCRLVLENGWPIYAHICSSPIYALGDLWQNRSERQQAWKERGLELEIVDQIPHSQLPQEIIDRNESGAYIDWAKATFGDPPEVERQPSAVLTFSDGSEAEVRP